jgi:AcrR family transcriptional regulator
MNPTKAVENRREQILREAARLFAERGFHGVGVDEIGAAVGISGPGLYRHFAGKDAMLAELLVGIRPLIILHDRELDRLRDSDRKLVRQLQRQYVEEWVGVVRRVYPDATELEARAAVHAVFGLLNSTPHLGGQNGVPDHSGTAALLRRLALGALEALDNEDDRRVTF